MATKPIKKPAPDPYIGKRIRVSAEGEVIAHYPSCTTAPERVSIKVGGITTVIPVKSIEVLS